jgi:high-affinity iron transporter
MFADLWAGGLIGFREALEATLLVVIFLLIARKLERPELMRGVWKGVGIGLVLSLLTALFFEAVIGGFEENEAWFEGVLMLLSALVIAVVVLHLIRHWTKHEIELRIEEMLASGADPGRGAMFIALFSVWREGSETVVFMSAGTETAWALLGLLFGIAAAVTIGWLILERGVRVDVKRLFSVTTVLLIFVGAGLAAHGVHELQEDEVGLIPVFVDELWSVNPAWDGTGAAPLLHEKGAIGGLFAAAFGWNGNPTLLEVLTWAVYASTLGWLYLREDEAHSPGEEDAPMA